MHVQGPGTAQSVWLSMGWTVRGSNPGGGRGAIFSAPVQTGPGAHPVFKGPGLHRWHDLLWAGRSGDRIPVGGASFSPPVQTGAHPTSSTMSTVSFPGVNSGWGMTLTPHPLLVPRSRKSRAIPLPPYGLHSLYRASVPVQGCTLPYLFTLWHPICRFLDPLGLCTPFCSLYNHALLYNYWKWFFVSTSQIPRLVCECNISHLPQNNRIGYVV